MKLYLANCTKQAQDFVWRPRNLPPGAPPKKIRIDVGTQQLMPGDWLSQDVTHLLQQHARFGLVDAADIQRNRAFVGLCFSLDKPVNMREVMTALATNDAILVERGVELRRRAAVAAEGQLQQQAPAAGLRAVELTVVEDRRDGGAPLIDETVRVERGGGGNDGNSGGRGRRGRSRAA